MIKHLLTISVALMLWLPNFASAADPKVAFIYVCLLYTSDAADE